MGPAKNMIKKEKDYIKEGEMDEEMVPASAAGKTEISYLFGWRGGVFVHCSQYAGSFFRTWRLWKYFKG